MAFDGLTSPGRARERRKFSPGGMDEVLVNVATLVGGDAKNSKKSL
jgi:hypothetical protein